LAHGSAAPTIDTSSVLVSCSFCKRPGGTSRSFEWIIVVFLLFFTFRAQKKAAALQAERPEAPLDFWFSRWIIKGTAMLKRQRRIFLYVGLPYGSPA
jgi:hypothetical protein